LSARVTVVTLLALLLATAAESQSPPPSESPPPPTTTKETETKTPEEKRLERLLRERRQELLRNVRPLYCEAFKDGRWVATPCKWADE